MATALADPAAADRVRASFARQGLMATLGARLVKVAPGVVAIALPASPRVSQQQGYVHAGALGAIADSAGGYAAFTLQPAGRSVLTVEFKLNLLAPAEGPPGAEAVATGTVVRAGRTLSVCDLEVHMPRPDGRPRLVAKGLQTVMAVPGRGDEAPAPGARSPAGSGSDGSGSDGSGS